MFDDLPSPLENKVNTRMDSLKNLMGLAKPDKDRFQRLIKKKKQIVKEMEIRNKNRNETFKGIENFEIKSGHGPEESDDHLTTNPEIRSPKGLSKNLDTIRNSHVFSSPLNPAFSQSLKFNGQPLSSSINFRDSDMLSP